MTKRKSKTSNKSLNTINFSNLTQKLDHAINKLKDGTIDEKSLICVQLTNDIEEIFKYSSSKNSSKLYLSNIFEHISHIILDDFEAINTDLFRDIIIDLLLNIFLGSFRLLALSLLSSERLQLALVNIISYNNDIDPELLDSWINLLLLSLLSIDKDQIFQNIQSKLINTANDFNNHILQMPVNESMPSFLKYFVRLSFLGIFSPNLYEYQQSGFSNEILFYIEFSNLLISYNTSMNIQPSIFPSHICTKLIHIFHVLGGDSLLLTRHSEFLLESLYDSIKSCSNDTISLIQISDDESFEEHITMKLDQELMIFRIENGTPMSDLFREIIDLLTRSDECAQIKSLLLNIISELLISYYHHDVSAFENLYEIISNIWSVTKPESYIIEWIGLWKNMILCSYRSGLFNLLLERYSSVDNDVLEEILDLSNALGQQMLRQGRADELITEGIVTFILRCISQYKCESDIQSLESSLNALNVAFKLLGSDEAIQIASNCKDDITLILKDYSSRFNNVSTN